jgi:amidase
MMAVTSKKDYKAIAREAQQKVLDKIPPQWRIPPDTKALHTGDARSFITKCGILNENQLDITRLTATEVLKLIHTGELKAVEVVEAFCARAAIAHQLVNCLTDFYPHEAIAQARALDDDFARTGKIVGPLHGMPMAVKDIMNVKDKVTTLAWVAWVDSPPSTFDASPVRVMRDAGAIFFGRTTMPQTGMALETVSNLWGRTLNPYNPAFGSGGSSGGDGVLCALRGEPAAPITTDIGGSIRAPGAFNGLYAMRPTADRVPRNGLIAVAPGNNSIKVSAGPNCHSMEDLRLFTELILTHPTLPYEPTTIPGFWIDTPPPSGKLRIGLLSTDGVVDVHPPIRRAMAETAAKLQAAGYEITRFVPPFDLWEAALTTWALYFQTGAKEHLALLEEAGEPTIPQFEHNFNVFKTRELTVPELFKHNTAQAAYKAAFQLAWDAHRIDCILSPCAPMAGVPHDFPVWWGYTTIWNLLDYPSIIMPIKDFKINAIDDPKDSSYKPRDNPFDRRNWELCRST